MWGCGGGTSEQVCGVVGVGPVSRFFRVVGVGPVSRCVGLWGWDQGGGGPGVHCLPCRSCSVWFPVCQVMVECCCSLRDACK